ncbi:MAG: LysR family transcriptional regulator [Veillonella sp.]|nr:LysR family transcriptional regulator [Veillonella sp.]
MKELPTMQELQSFITYNKTGSFTLAAQSMNITQSAFSAQMKKLERLVGVKLISRSTRGSRLTPEGELFLPEAEQVLDTLERAIQSIRLASKVERPILNIGVLRSLGDIRLNGYVSHFFQNHPEFSVSIYDMEEEELMLDLRENRIDIALLYLPLKAIQQQPLLMYPPKYFMYRTLKNYVGNGQQNLHIRGSRLSNPYTMIDYCQKNKSGCIVARQILNSLNINDGYIPLEKPFKLQVCFAFKKNNSKSETMHTFMDYVHSESPARL